VSHLVVVKCLGSSLQLKTEPQGHKGTLNSWDISNIPSESFSLPICYLKRQKLKYTEVKFEVLSYGRETCSFTLRKFGKLEVFGKKVIGMTLEPGGRSRFKGDYMRKSFMNCIPRQIEWKSWEGHVAGIGTEGDVQAKIFGGKILTKVSV